MHKYIMSNVFLFTYLYINIRKNSADNCLAKINVAFENYPKCEQ